MKKNINHVVAKNNLSTKKISDKKKGNDSLADERNRLIDGYEQVGSDFDGFLQKIEESKKVNAKNKKTSKKDTLTDVSVMENRNHLGSDFDAFLLQQEMAQEVNLAAIKKIISYEIQKEMSQKRITQTTMADRLGTSRAGLKRLLDPDNYSITLHTLNKVAFILNKRLEIVFHDL